MLQRSQDKTSEETMELSNVMVIEGPDKNSVSREVGTQLDQDRFKRK